MDDSSLQYRVTYGGWYQRTTLHMSEIYDFFAHAHSRLPLDSTKLTELRDSLALVEVSREPGYLEYVRARTTSDIEIRYYEDGLYVLETTATDLTAARSLLETYFTENFSPAIAYIFSLGAPTPKVLANIKTVHPTVVGVSGTGAEEFAPDPKTYGETYSRLVHNGMTVIKTPEHIFMVGQSDSLPGLVEMQIFFREFKDQLEKYLDIHRTIWEEISSIKEGKKISGAKVEDVRGRLDGYEKTVSLIDNRIAQMGTYVETRSSIAKHMHIEADLVTLFEYKFETLADTLSYMKEVWKMTAAYLSSAIQNLVEIKNQTTSNNIKSLQTITSIGVISGVLGYLSGKALPSVTQEGIIYFLLLLILTWVINTGISVLYKHKKYSLSFGNRVDL